MKITPLSLLVSSYAKKYVGGNIKSIEYDESNTLGKGGFGEVFLVTSINGKKSSDYAIKIFNDSADKDRKGFSTIQELQKLISDKHDTLSSQNTSLFVKYPALRGLPLASFTTKQNNVDICGYLMLNLTEIGFKELSKVASNKSERRAFEKMSVGLKMKMCVELIHAFKLLYDVYYLHADLKQDAFFVSSMNGSIIIIDYDGGVVLSDPNDKPTTLGTIQPWLAPEIKTHYNNRNKILVTYYSELWSIAYCIHFIFFLHDPYFFLSEVTQNSFVEYNARFKWPEIDNTYNYLHKKNYPQRYNNYSKYYNKTLPLTIQRKLSQTFSANIINVNRRTTYDQWLIVLSANTKKPEIQEFNISSSIITDLNGIIVTWKVINAVEVTIDGRPVASTGKYSFFTKQDCDLVIQAKGIAGKPVRKIKKVVVDKSTPQILNFSSNAPVGGIRSNAPLKLQWNVRGAAEISINNHIGDVTFLTSVTVKPNVKQLEYELTATSPFGVIAKSTLAIEVNQAPPSINRFELSPNLVIKSINTPGTLVWDVTGAKSVELSDHGIIPPKGSLEVLPRRPKTYTLTAKALNGKTTSKEVIVEVLQIPPVIKKFTLDRYSINSSTPVLISWEVEEAHQVILHPIGEVTGTAEMYYEVSDDMVFELEAIGYFGGVAKSKRRIIVSKRPPVIRDFRLSKVFINEPASINLTWNVDGAKKIEIDNGVGVVPKTGNHQLNVSKDTTVSIFAMSPFGIQTKRKMRITTNKANPIINVTYSPAVRRQQAPVTLKWSTLFTKHLTLDGFGELPLKGEITLNNLVSQNLLFTAEGHFGQVTIRNVNPLIF